MREAQLSQLHAKEVEAAEKVRAANQRVVEGLNAERAVLASTERERFVAQAMSRLSAEAAAQQRREVQELSGALFDEQQALQARQRLMDEGRSVTDRARTATDIGGYPPDRGRFATMLLIDLVVSHSDDWFHFPVQTRIGHAVTLESVEVVDDFDQTWTLVPPADWSLFRTRGLDPRTLLLWPTVATPIRGEPLEDVALGLDEDANRVFAVELRVEGSDLPTAARPLGPEGPEAEVDATVPVAYDFRVTTGLPDFWHPYEVGTVAGRRISPVRRQTSGRHPAPAS